jgi:hypothetical protein
MTTNEIKEILSHDLYKKGHCPIVHNFQGAGLGECDVLSITKTKMTNEFEIKISRSDFFKDFKKEEKHKNLSQGIGAFFSDYRQDHWLIAPNFFWYVCPEGLIKVEEVPAYAGLIYIVGATCVKIKKAPKIHKHPATELLYTSILRNLTCKLIFGSSYMTFLQKKSALQMQFE